MNIKRLIYGIAAAGFTAMLIVCSSAYAADSSNILENQPKSQPYVFAWQFADSDAMKPRGGDSKGVPVTLDTKPSDAWLKLQQLCIGSYERDRRAILAMVGEFRVSFDFVEVAGFTDNYKPAVPYRNWATEKVYVLEDSGKHIVLQHVLLSQSIAADGTVEKPVLTKHWRQDWQYEPKQVLVYRGHNAWQSRAVPESERKGAWSQTVYQVDDSPRYGGVAVWQHLSNFSSWNSPDTWRPLPRREYTVRDDYQLLMGNNRQIILPTGWVHEQQNNKVVLDSNAQPQVLNAVIAREFGFNRYERITGFDFSLADAYVKNTEPFWSEIRKQWAELTSQGKPIQLRSAPDKGMLYLPVVTYADGMSEGKQRSAKEISGYAKKAVQDYLAEKGGASAKPSY
ncbi:DUF6607 family protein [Methyloradius palustris]|uniref:Uncharacterized protein n=1 Tax=Methyloradius palustris TaxID=2778876 RepID=A0A8D5JM78_9PROT|nr:DUF6607 family protein [Methyloradius palustris]BCM25585.1 hypothetical protein ZMTM_18440 [Methyloradius palustris]